MEEYTIYPLKVGELNNVEKSNLTYQVNPGTKVVAPVIMYLIKGKNACILVDSGASDEEWAAKYHHNFHRPPEMEPAQALKNIGVDVKDVDFVVNTHLHWDHCFNNDLFPNAKIYVQKREMEYAVAPLPPHWVFYESCQLGLTPPWFRAYNRTVPVDGDFKLLPGIDLVALPGHSPGFQGVLVNTSGGRYLIASDTQPLFESWKGGGIHKHYISGIHYRLDEYYATLEKLDAICDFILPGHDPKVFEKSQYPG